MNFWQQHIVNEQGFEATKFTLAIADSYSELLSDSMTDGNRVDVIQLNDNFKDALNTDESSFKVKELSFSVDELSCHNEVNTNCLSFLLECKKRSNTRYIALYETKGSTAISFDNMLFLGKLDTKVTGDDIVHATNSIYTHDIKAKRLYKFNALEFSVAVLDECSISKEIRDEAGTAIQNIRARTSRAEIEALHIERKMKSGTTTGSAISVSYDLYQKPLLNLYELINLLFTKCNSLLSDLKDINVVFNLIESDLGISGVPTNIGDLEINAAFSVAAFNLKTLDGEFSQAKKLYLTDTENSTDRAVLVNSAIYDPSILFDSGLEDKFTDLSETDTLKKNLINIQRPFSIISIENMSSVLFEIARCFGCYLYPTYEIVSGVLNINIELKSIKAFSDNTIIYPIGATDGSIDSSGEANSQGETIFYANASNYTIDGIDTTERTVNDKDYLPSKNYVASSEKRTNLNKTQKTDFKRLLFSSGASFISRSYGNKSEYTILNSYTGSVENSIKEDFNYLCNTIYISSDYGGGLNLFLRPIQSILWQDNGVNKNTSLVEYVNSITANNREYYKTEYSLTVPYYSAFAIKDGTGAITSIGSENLKIGRTIRIKERKKAFVTGSWVDFSEDVDFKIVEIEKNLTTPEVKLKLQSISAFAYGVYDGDGSEIKGEFDNNDSSGGGTGLVGNTFQYYEIDSTSDDIFNGDRVVILDIQKIIKAKAHSDHYGLDFGFAKNSGVSGDFIPVDTGELSFCNDYTLTPLDVVFVRTGDDTTSNISQTGIDDITGGENLYYKIGTALSPTVIKVEVEQYEFE